MLDNPDARTRFYKARDDSLTKKRRYMRHRQEFIRYLVGRNWGDSPWRSGASMPINLFEKGYSTYMRLLVAQAPAILIRTDHDELKPMAEDASLVLNMRIKESHLNRTLKRWVGDSLFGLGIIKVGLRQSGMVPDPDTGEQTPVGELFAANVSLDDWVHDMSAKTLEPEDCWFYGHQFRAPLDEVRENPRFNKSVRSHLVETRRETMARTGERRAEEIGAGNKVEMTPHVTLWEYYFPKEDIVVTTTDKQEDRPLSIEEWDGADAGPYEFLYYTEVPDNSMPLPPAASWKDLVETVNKIYLKEQDNAENSKTVLGYREGSDEDALKITEAENLQAVSMTDPDAVRDFRFNGVRAENMGFLEQSLQLANSQMGNLELLSGSGTQSPTASQDMILSRNASTRLDDMRDVVYERTQAVMERWVFYYWHDPIRIDHGVREIPNTGIHVPVGGEDEFGMPRGITPTARIENWNRFNFSVEPYSMQVRSPEERAAAVDQFMLQILIPGMEFWTGNPEILQAYVQMKAKYENMPELLELTKSLGVRPPQQQEIGKVGSRTSPLPNSPQEGDQPSQTERGQVQQMIQNMVAGNESPEPEMSMGQGEY